MSIFKLQFTAALSISPLLVNFFSLYAAVLLLPVHRMPDVIWLWLSTIQYCITYDSVQWQVLLNIYAFLRTSLRVGGWVCRETPSRRLFANADNYGRPLSPSTSYAFLFRQNANAKGEVFLSKNVFICSKKVPIMWKLYVNVAVATELKKKLWRIFSTLCEILWNISI